MTKRRANHEGYITRRVSGSWRAQIMVDGQRLNFAAKTKTECLNWIRMTLAQKDRGYNYVHSQIELVFYLDKWWDIAKHALRPKTLLRYKQLIDRQIVPNLGRIKLKELNLELVEQFYQDLSKQGVGVRTIRFTHAVLHSALEKAIKYGLLLQNPAHGATLPRLSIAEIKVLNESQISLFLQTAHNHRLEALFHLAITTGMRQGEILGLKWGDIDLQSGVLYVRRQVQWISGDGFIFCEPKTKAGRRSIKLGKGTSKILERHLQQQQLERAKAGERWQNQELVFPSTIGTPLNSSNLLKEFHQILKRSNLPNIRFHDLRHTAASLMINHNIPLTTVSNILGHSKPSVTLDIYSHAFIGMQDQAAEIMDKLIPLDTVDFESIINHESCEISTTPNYTRGKRKFIITPTSGTLYILD